MRSKNDVKIKVRELLQEKNITCRSIAMMLNIKERNVSNQINGDIELSLEILLAALSFLPDISLDYIFRGEGQQYRNQNETPQAPYLNTPGAHDNITNVGSGTQIVGAGVKPTMTKEEAMAALIKQNQEIISLLSK